MIFIELLPVMIGLVCIAAAFFPVRSGKVAHPCYTEGTVVAYRSQRMYRHHSETEALAPVVRYTTPDGEITAVSRHYVPEWQYRHQSGDRVKVCYNAQQPDVFRICGDGGEWRKGVLLTVGIGTLLSYGVLWIQYH